MTSPQASSIRPLPRQGEERRAEIHMSIWSIWDKKSSHGPKSVADLFEFAPRGPPGEPKKAQDGLQDDPRGPRWRIILARAPQDDSIWPKMVPKKPPRWPKTPPRRSK